MFTFLFLSFFASAEMTPPFAPIEVPILSVTRLLPRADCRELKRGDLLVLDLDNTVFREAQLLGTDDWYMRAHAAVTALGYPPKEASDHLEPLNYAIKNASQMRLMEEGLPHWIARLQACGVTVMGLTARHPGLAELTLRQLRELGIDFGRSRLRGEFDNFKVPGFTERAFRYASGVAFTDGAHKGRVMQAMLARAAWRPGRVLAVDDRIHHVHSFVEVLLEEGIPGQVIHYLKSEEEDYDEDAAAFQQRYFEATGLLLTDEQARAHCATFLSEDESLRLRP